MKRRRPSPSRLRILQANLWGRPVIPPLTVVRHKDQHEWLGTRQFRIGYYSRMDGLNCVWLVNKEGVYEQTVDQIMIATDFDVLVPSSETDIYGQNREVIRPLVALA